MWARLENGVWVEARPPLVNGNFKLPRNIFSVWTNAELAAIGIYPVTQVEPPEGQRATGWELADVENLPVRRPSGTEAIPTPPPPNLAGWQWDTVLDVTGMRARINEAVAGMDDGIEKIALLHKLNRAGNFPWSDFIFVAGPLATAEELIAFEAKWREVHAATTQGGDA